MSTLQLGFFGLRNAGKTVGATVLYHTESGDGLNVTVKDAETIKYLRPLADALERGDVPQPTAGPPKHMKWRVEVGDARYDVDTTDFPGELLEAIGQGSDPVNEAAMAQFRNQVRDWFVHCDAILLFVDSTQAGTVRYRDALVRILDEMSRRPTLRGNTVRAVAVVFTKGDRLARSPHELADETATNRLLAQHPLYEVVRRRLREHRDRLKTRVFLSSALGWNFLPVADKSRRKVEPCNWFTAVRWAVEQAAALVEENHKQILDELEQEIAKRGAGQRVALMTNYRRMLRWLNEADRDFRLSTGPCARRFFALRQRLMGGQRTQRRARVVACVVAALALLGAGYRFERQSRLGTYDAYERLQVERPGEAGVKERLAYYDQTIAAHRHDWLWMTTDRRRAIDALAESDREVLARVAAEEAFAAWSADDERDDKARRPAHRHVAASAYLQKHGRAARPERLDAVTRVAEQTRPAFDADQAEWRKLIAAPAGQSEEYARKIGDLLRYADKPDSFQAEAARAAAQATRLDWDGHEYAGLRELRQKSAAPESFAALESAAKDYLRPNRHTRTMAGPVENLLGAIEEMRKGKDYWVVIDRVLIPAGSDLHAEFFGYPNCSVRVAVGTQSYETKMVKPPKKDSDGGFTVVMNERLGPYRAAWGSGKATVTVITNRSFFPNDVASKTITDDELVMSHFTEPVGVTCRRGKTVTVATDCPDARLPDLPDFHK